MFGMGFTEILLIAIVAVIALGPEKLPDTMVQIAKMFKKIKDALSDAKTTFDNELNIAELKDEANKFKATLEETKSSVSIESKIDLGLKGILDETPAPVKEIKKEEVLVEKKEKVSFKTEEKHNV